MIRLSTGLLVLVLSTGPASDQSAKPGFDSVDVNRNGVISLAELATVFPDDGTRLFSGADKDRDGQLTVDEYVRLAPHMKVAGK